MAAPERSSTHRAPEEQGQPTGRTREPEANERTPEMAREHRPSMSPGQLLVMQRLAGNQAVLSWLGASTGAVVQRNGGRKRKREDDDPDFVLASEKKRKTAPTSAFPVVYMDQAKDVSAKAGKGSVPSDAVWKVPCEEGCAGPIYMTKDWKECGTDRRPPLCHNVPDAHIRGALLEALGDSRYRGPAYMAPGWDTLQKNCEWSIANIRPGHAACNQPRRRKTVPTWNNANKTQRARAKKHVIDYLTKKKYWK